MRIYKTKEEKPRLLHLYLVTIFLLALLLRVLCVRFVRTEQLYDFATYQLLAENIAAGLGHTLDGHPVAWQGSGYPYLLGGLYRMVGSTDMIYGKQLNLVLSMGTLMICWLLYRKLFSNRYLCAAAFTITAFLPQYIVYVNVLGTEILYTFLLAGILCLSLYFPNQRRIYPIIGILIGLSALTKPFMLAYPVICGTIAWTTQKNLKETLLFTGVLLCGTILVVAPWSFRNYRIYGKLIPISYNGGYVLYTNNNDMNANGAWLDLQKAASNDPESLVAIDQFLENGHRSIKEAYDIEPFLKQKARSWMWENPLEFIKLGCLRVKQTFFAGVNDIEQWAMNGHGHPRFGSEEDKVRIQRNYNFVMGAFGVITHVINSAGFVFCLATFLSYLKGFFSKHLCLDAQTSILFINLAFFSYVSFVYGGEARYAYPVFLFMIPAFVSTVSQPYATLSQEPV